MEEDINITPVIPKKRLRLGLGRYTGGSMKGSQTTPGFRIKVRKDLWSSPKAATTTTTPTNRNDEVPASITLSPSTQTPTADSKIIDVLRRKAASTTLCRPYCLSLNRNIRKAQTKKRLKFYLANEVCEDEENNQPIESEKAAISSSTGNEQQNTVNHDTKGDSAATTGTSILTTAADVHTKKRNELKASIATWKAGFVASLTELQENLEPRLEFSVLLAQLKIAPEMINYLD